MTSWRTAPVTILAIVLLMVVSACGVKHIDPPLYFESSANAAALVAGMRALEVNGARYQVAPTGSMEPLLKGGDFIASAPIPFAQLQLGQVIVYKADWRDPNAAPVVHRLVQKDSDGWILSGDANPRSEAHWRVTEANYLGVVVGIYRAAP